MALKKDVGAETGKQKKDKTPRRKKGFKYFIKRRKGQYDDSNISNASQRQVKNRKTKECLYGYIRGAREERATRNRGMHPNTVP